MSGSLTSVPMVSLLAFSLLHAVWAVNGASPDPRSLKADVVFLLDTSKYMTEGKFNKAKNFMTAFAGEFDIGPSRLNLGVITYDRTAHTQFWLNNYTTNTSLFAAIDAINFATGDQHPFLAPPLRRAREDAFTEVNGDRQDAPDTLIVLGDGRAFDTNSIDREKAELNKTDIRIYCVGFFQIITPVMVTIASKFENNFRVTPTNGLDSVRAQLTKAVSEEISALLPPESTESTNSSSQNSNATTPPSYTPGPLYFHPQPPCVDSITSCAEYGFFYCNPGGLWAQYICRKHCGVCVQHCEYKGLWYSHGAQWQDGCAYDCACVDGATGHYQCYNKCPTYLFLPPHCTLVQLPGLCCLQPVCDFGAVYQTTTDQNVGSLNGYQVCVYNGTKYYQSQRWTVGCDTECFCDDAGIGLYTCHTKCAQYGMLPSNCRMVKKPDDCCSKPECQFYTTMGPFIGVGQPSGNGQSVYTVFTF